MTSQTISPTRPAEVSAGTPTDELDTNDQLMMSGDGDTGAAVAAARIASEVTPRTDISSPPHADTGNASTSSHGPVSGTSQP